MLGRGERLMLRREMRGMVLAQVSHVKIERMVIVVKNRERGRVVVVAGGSIGGDITLC